MIETINDEIVSPSLTLPKGEGMTRHKRLLSNIGVIFLYLNRWFTGTTNNEIASPTLTLPKGKGMTRYKRLLSNIGVIFLYLNRWFIGTTNDGIKHYIDIHAVIKSCFSPKKVFFSPSLAQVCNLCLLIITSLQLVQYKRFLMNKYFDKKRS